jgi:uncharacterized membrane-anchored protein YitT (DUF2179 family)
MSHILRGRDRLFIREWIILMISTFKKLSLVIIGLLLTALGIKFLSLAKLVFGGTAGIASIFTYGLGHTWGFWFFIVNLPFFYISLKKLGKWFTISSLLSITAISIVRDSLDIVYLPNIPMVFSSLIAGILIGIGVTFVLNNGSSLGGIHILALYFDQTFRINRGITLFISDFLIILSAGFMVGWSRAFVSIISIVVASTIVGRYKKSPIRPMAADATASVPASQAS